MDETYSYDDQLFDRDGEVLDPCVSEAPLSPIFDEDEPAGATFQVGPLEYRLVEDDDFAQADDSSADDYAGPSAAEKPDEYAGFASSRGEPSALQPLVDALFAEQPFAKQLDFVLLAEAFDLDEDLLEVVNLLPPGFYLREEMCDQLNSIITAHGWGNIVGTVS